MVKRLFREEKGFTLVELLIVMVILGILAAVAVPRFIDMRRDAQASACRSAQASLQTAIELFEYYNTMDKNTFQLPSTSLDEWNEALTKSYSYAGGTVGPFLRSEAKCPGDGEITISASKDVSCTVHGALTATEPEESE